MAWVGIFAACDVMSRKIKECINVEDFRVLALKNLPCAIADFLDGGAEDEHTLRRNRESFGDWALLPKAMSDVSFPDSQCQVLGQNLLWPFVVAPTGMPGMVHPDGEVGIAVAAQKVGALYTLSTMASCSIEKVAAATQAAKAFQLYLFRDRAISLELLQRAKASGYKALILTVDVQVPANRERDRRSGMVIPPKFNIKTVFDFARCPVWCWNTLVRKPVTLANFAGRRAQPGVSLLSFINEQFDPAISWSDIEWVAKNWNGPLAIKGILSADDAVSACEHGASAVILSNHGGRQLDGAVSPMDVLPSVVERLESRAEIILDGGIRRGTDMLKSLALGATACMAGRLGLYGLGAGGAKGVEGVFGALRSEFQRDLALLGVSNIAQIDRSRIREIGAWGHRAGREYPARNESRA